MKLAKQQALGRSILPHPRTWRRIVNWACVLVPLCLGYSVGCGSLQKNWKEKLPWSPQARLKSSKYESPAQMIAIWSPDILTQPGKPPTRGFGGRLYFYNEKNQTIPVEGQLVVFGYDDTSGPHDQGTPQRKFAFTPEQFTKHYSESDLGASYSIWIPWDGVGGDQKNVSLVPVFTGSNGKVVMGELAANVLPGRTSELAKKQSPASLIANRPASTSAAVPAVTPEVQQVSHELVTGMPSPETPSLRGERMRSSTIHLTPSLQRRVINAPAQQLNAIPGATPAVQTPTVKQELAAPVEPAQAAPHSGPLTARFGPPKFPVRGGLSGQSSLPAPWTPPYPATPPSGLQSPQ